jgi:DNA-binding NarL/FixJ family response regulator
MKRVRILLADGHQMQLEALASLLGREFEVAAVIRDGSQLMTAASSLQPDIVIMDILLPNCDGIDVARGLLKDMSTIKILFLTMYADLPMVEEAFRIGASGYVLKSGRVDELVKAIQCVARGGTYVTPLLGDVISALISVKPEQKSRGAILTSRQRDVLQLLVEGRTMKEIGQLLHITARTTESHKYEIMRTLGMKTTAELIRYWIRNGEGCAQQINVDR